ncbi:hypothetical protein EI546_04710 [Aequorivita sp. H23M31]|uniref:Lysozyme family protein n=1 Tax=Aequorivita ciconiae TaxID=2494375 RepID=A0A410G1F3_9FLAO|nr:hypothetical protein [Aequorivita sp. H23M31]QAA81070.1 hypothetical protein EI546_04710 [Aequorivita sp. H23M31]
MAKIDFTQTLQKQYSDLYSTMEIRLDKLAIVENNVNKILDAKSRYEKAAEFSSIPWYFVGIIHSMEAGQNFSRHIHNGDPLTQRTTHVPSGRPSAGNPPFTWEESAMDALKYHNLDKVDDWSLPRILYEFERYNGWGYRLYHPHVYSPYLWSASNHYKSGKYIADGTWSETAVSQQIGAVVLLRRLVERKEIPTFYTLATEKKTFFTYSTKPQPRGEDLQRFLNTFDGITLLVDGVTGKMTSKAVKKLFGNYLPNTPE